MGRHLLLAVTLQWSQPRRKTALSRYSQWTLFWTSMWPCYLTGGWTVIYIYSDCRFLLWSFPPSFDCCRLQIASFHRLWQGLTWVVLEKLKRLCHAWKQTLEEWRIRKSTMASAVQAGEMMVNIRVLTEKIPNWIIRNSPILMQSRSYFSLLHCCHGDHVYILQIQPRKEVKWCKRKINKGRPCYFVESLKFYTFFKVHVWSIIL